MLKKKKIVAVTGMILVVSIMFMIFGTPRYQSMKFKNGNFTVLENKLKEEVNTYSVIDLKELTDFDWDEGYVFPAYYPPNFIYEKVGVEWTTTETYLEFLLFHELENQIVDDDQYVIVFKNNGKVILSAKYSLSKLPIIFKVDDFKFTSKNAKFIVSTAKQYTEDKIKELVLKK